MVSKQKILIVDDDENIAELISLYLSKRMFRHQDRSRRRKCSARI